MTFPRLHPDRIIGLKRLAHQAQFAMEGSPSTVAWFKSEAVQRIWKSIDDELRATFPKVSARDHAAIAACIQQRLREKFPEEYIEVYVVNPG